VLITFDSRDAAEADESELLDARLDEVSYPTSSLSRPSLRESLFSTFLVLALLFRNAPSVWSVLLISTVQTHLDSSTILQIRSLISRVERFVFS